MKETKLIWTVVVAVVLFSFIGIAYFPFSPAKWAHEHSYDKQEKVTLYVNKVGPFRNPQETYSYYSLPFCPPDKIVESKTEGLGEALLGYELIESRIIIRFREDMPRAKICARTLNKQQAKSFKNAIFQHYWYQLFLDDLPIWGMVGEYLEDDTSPQAFIYTHKSFSISWNENRVIEVNLTSEQPKAVEEGMELEFTYSVEWHHTDTPFEDRFRKYLDRSFFEHKIHWFSIFNSFMMVIFLVGLVSIILMRTLRKDYARFGIKDDEDGQDDDISDESGWKQVHGDVFRAPSRLILFSSLVGTGHQLVILVLSVLFLATVGTYYARRGTVVTAAIVCYAFTSFVAGYSSGGYYARNNGKHWIKTMLCTASLFPGLCFVIALGLNFIALSYESLNYIPFGSNTSDQRSSEECILRTPSLSLHPGNSSGSITQAS